MTGRELLVVLEASGTGERKLKAAEKWMEKNGGDGCDGKALLKAMTESKEWPEGTCKKAAYCLEHKDHCTVDGLVKGGFMDKPPKNLFVDPETKISNAIKDGLERAAKAFKEKHAEEQALAQAQGVGCPVPPAGSEPVVKKAHHQPHHKAP